MYNIRLILYTEEKQKVKFARERNLLTWSKFSFFQIISVNRRRSSSNFRGLLWRHFRLDYVTKWRHKYYNLAAIMVGPTCPTVQLAPVSPIIQEFIHVSLRLTLNSFPNKPWILHVCSKSLLKTLLEKEKLLETSNFSFFYRVFYPFGELSCLKLLSANSGSSEESKILSFGKGLSLPNNNVLDWSKLKALANNKIINVTENLNLFWEA